MLWVSQSILLEYRISFADIVKPDLLELKQITGESGSQYRSICGFQSAPDGQPRALHKFTNVRNLE
ncbi:hypothetical protein PM082_024486 [Marasmius tenuissimus]|nr:hypothetical protein PM082_024486 [Marasmius tenuissimus]